MRMTSVARAQRRQKTGPLLPLWEKVPPKATDEGCAPQGAPARGALQRRTPHPAVLSARPPSPARGEGIPAAGVRP